MDVNKLSTKQAVKLFGWHAVHYPGDEAVLRLPAGTENYFSAKVTLSDVSDEILTRWEKPEERGGCYALAERIKARNWPCQFELPTQTEQKCYTIARKGAITVKREDFDGLTLPFNWSLLPRLRTGYLIKFTGEAMTISSEPPPGADDKELARLLWIHTDHPYAKLLEHLSGVKTLAESHQQPLDWSKVIPMSRTPPPVRQYLRKFVNGEWVQTWTDDPHRLQRFNRASIRHHHLSQNISVPSDNFNEAMAELDRMQAEIEADPRYHRTRLVNAAIRAVTGRKR